MGVKVNSWPQSAGPKLEKNVCQGMVSVGNMLMKDELFAQLATENNVFREPGPVGPVTVEGAPVLPVGPVTVEGAPVLPVGPVTVEGAPCCPWVL